MIDNLENRNKYFLFEIFHQIQQELHDSNIQLIEAKYNNELEYIKFKQNMLQTDVNMQTNIIELM